MLRRSLVLLACIGRSLAQETGAAVHSDKAAEFVQKGELRNAEAELRNAVALSPADPKLLTSLGGVLAMEGELEQANVYLAKAVKLAPEEAVFRRNLAANEWQLGRLTAAQQNLELLLHANPNDTGSIYLLGMVSENQKNYQQSIRLLEAVPQIVERQPEASVALASSYYHTNRREIAHARLKALSAKSVKPEVLWMAGRVAMGAHDYPLALEFETEAANQLPDSYQVFSMKADAELKLRYYSQAVNSAQRAVQLHSSVETRRQLAEARWRSGDKALAMQEFDSITREFPKGAPACEIYGTLLLQDGAPDQKPKAISLLKKALALDSASVEANYQLANLELTDGKLESALKYLQRGMQTDPDDSRLHFAISRVYRRLARNSDADREMERYEKLKASQN